MEHIAPLIQTVLWVVLITGIIWRFNNVIYDLLIALKKRIESGSTVKAGPFEISQQLKSQDAPTQKKKVEMEMRELLQSENKLSDTFSVKPSNIQARYFQAEDLVMRAIQAEYGEVISRQVTGGSDIGFDGAFSVNGKLHVVEVKYSYHKLSKGTVRTAIERVLSPIERYGWPNVCIIFALVLESPSSLVIGEEWLEEISNSYSTQLKFVASI